MTTKSKWLAPDMVLVYVFLVLFTITLILIEVKK